MLFRWIRRLYQRFLRCDCDQFKNVRLLGTLVTTYELQMLDELDMENAGLAYNNQPHSFKEIMLAIQFRQLHCKHPQAKKENAGNCFLHCRCGIVNDISHYELHTMDIILVIASMNRLGI